MIQFNLVQAREGRTLTVLLDDGPVALDDDHPSFDEVLAEVQRPFPDTERVRELTDLSFAVATKFQPLSERVSVADGRVFFNGDEVHSSITNQIVRFLEAGLPSWQPLVNFMESVSDNPNEHSREQLYDWLHARDFTILPTGEILGYKGVTKKGDGTFVSGFSGTAIVDGQTVEGQIPNAYGSTIEMPRSSVQHDPRSACSTGLHVGTFDYAKAYANGGFLKVAVWPRDVVSVPTDASGEKVRVCRYRVIEVIDAPETAVEEASPLAVYDWDDYTQEDADWVW